MKSSKWLHTLQNHYRKHFTFKLTATQACLAIYHTIPNTKAKYHAPAASHTRFDSPHLRDSNETLADQIRLLAVELPQL